MPKPKTALQAKRERVRVLVYRLNLADNLEAIAALEEWLEGQTPELQRSILLRLNNGVLPL